MNTNLNCLLKLLDDEDQNTVGLAMAEILRQDEDEVGMALREMQESENSALRRRSHQLQGILSIRRRRRALARAFQSGDMLLIKGMMESHLLWFDNDLERDLFEQWRQLVALADQCRPDTMNRLADFMNGAGFKTIRDLEPEQICIGTVMEDRLGADFVLCAIARGVAAKYGLRLSIVKIMGNFALLEPAVDELLCPVDGWRVVKRGGVEVTDWPPEKLLAYILSLLFYHAVSTDGFRYVHTIGSALAPAIGRDDMNFLPRPFATVK